MIIVPFLYTTLPLTLLRTRFFHHQFPYKTKNLSTKMKFAFRYLVSTCLIYKENLIFTIHETIYESFQASIFSWPVSCFSINLNKKWMFFKFSINWLNFLFFFILFFFFHAFFYWFFTLSECTQQLRLPFTCLFSFVFLMVCLSQSTYLVAPDILLSKSRIILDDACERAWWHTYSNHQFFDLLSAIHKDFNFLCFFFSLWSTFAFLFCVCQKIAVIQVCCCCFLNSHSCSN